MFELAFQRATVDQWCAAAFTGPEVSLLDCLAGVTGERERGARRGSAS
jgi:hypothetical protein